MITKLSNKLTLLTQNSKLLIVGSLEERLLEGVKKYFKTVELFEEIEASKDILNTTLYDQFEVVLFSFDKKSFESFRENNIEFSPKGIYIVTDEIYPQFHSFINDIYSILIDPTEDQLQERIYGAVSILETNNLIKTKEKVVNKYKNDAINDDIDTFLDQYSGNIMFINDDLNETLERLKDLEISKEIFSNISNNLLQLSRIFQENENLKKLSYLLEEFSQFLDSIELESIEPSRFASFDYLTNIIEDLTLYIDELFVYRLFKDVAIFEDSMENNIGYFESQLFGIKEDEDENLEFF